MNRVIEPLKMMGAKLSSDTGMLPIRTSGSKIINNFEYEMPIASAQVKSCLLFAALSSKKNIKITEPKITRDHTERMIEFFGGEILYENNQNSKKIQLNYSELEPKNSFDVPGDFSSAAFIIVATIISKDSEVVIKNVGLNESRKGLLDVLLLMGAKLEIKNKKKTSNEIVGDIHIRSSELRGIDVPDNIIPNIIDEIPILSIAACFAEGKTVIKNAAELRVKESDRLHAISEGMKKLRIKHDIFEDGISIFFEKVPKPLISTLSSKATASIIDSKIIFIASVMSDLLKFGNSFLSDDSISDFVNVSFILFTQF